MNKKIFIAALIMISLTGRLFAQNDGESYFEKMRPKNKTEEVFGMSKYYVNIRDFVHLKDAGMMLELNNVADFNRIKNLDSILNQFRKDIAFYKDSLEKYPGNVRIDYVLQDDHDFREIRFKKYKPDGDMYVNNTGDVSRLKVDDDTIRIIMHVHGEEYEFMKKMSIKDTNFRYRPWYTIQVAIWMNNYSDVDKLIADKSMLRHCMDTLQATKGKKTVSSPFRNPSSTVYRPYQVGVRRFTTYPASILKSETVSPWNISNRKNHISLGLNVGAGLVRNTIAPMGEIGLTYTNHRAYRNDDYFTFMSLSMTPYFFFDRSADGQFFIKDNWFANFQIGSPGDLLGLKTKLLTMGVGYLVVENGNYFKGPTMKAFMTLRLKEAVTISPEIIFTNNFKQIFPGITLKVF